MMAATHRSGSRSKGAYQKAVTLQGVMRKQKNPLSFVPKAKDLQRYRNLVSLQGYTIGMSDQDALQLFCDEEEGWSVTDCADEVDNGDPITVIACGWLSSKITDQNYYLKNKMLRRTIVDVAFDEEGVKWQEDIFFNMQEFASFRKRRLNPILEGPTNTLSQESESSDITVGRDSQFQRRRPESNAHLATPERSVFDEVDFETGVPLLEPMDTIAEDEEDEEMAEVPATPARHAASTEQQATPTGRRPEKVQRTEASSDVVAAAASPASSSPGTSPPNSTQDHMRLERVETSEFEAKLRKFLRFQDACESVGDLAGSCHAACKAAQALLDVCDFDNERALVEPNAALLQDVIDVYVEKIMEKISATRGQLQKASLLYPNKQLFLKRYGKVVISDADCLASAIDDIRICFGTFGLYDIELMGIIGDCIRYIAEAYRRTYGQRYPKVASYAKDAVKCYRDAIREACELRVRDCNPVKLRLSIGLSTLHREVLDEADKARRIAGIAAREAQATLLRNSDVNYIQTASVLISRLRSHSTYGLPRTIHRPVIRSTSNLYSGRSFYNEEEDKDINGLLKFLQVGPEINLDSDGWTPDPVVLPEAQKKGEWMKKGGEPREKVKKAVLAQWNEDPDGIKPYYEYFVEFDDALALDGFDPEASTKALCLSTKKYPWRDGRKISSFEGHAGCTATFIRACANVQQWVKNRATTD